MADAGYANGIPKVFNFVVRESPQNRQLAAYAQAEWERLLGVKTRLEVVQVSAMVDRQVAGTFDMISHAQCLGGAGNVSKAAQWSAGGAWAEHVRSL